MATDLGGVDARNSSNQATVGVIVKRNRNSPHFEGQPFSATIQQTHSPDDVIAVVRFDDRDDTVGSSYSNQSYVNNPL